MDEALSLVRAMTVEERLAQLLFVGFDGAELPDRYAGLIQRHGLGGLILFSRNVRTPAQTRALTDDAQSAARRSRQGLPLAISIDQEGGTVVRLTEAAGFAHMPGNMALGAADDETLTYRAARAAAAQLRSLGLTWNYAPVLDVNNNPANPVIGVRSYGAHPDLVARHGAAAIRGLQDGGVAACAKHFPGHGDTTVDSHHFLPVIGHGRERLAALELAPFRAAICAGADSIMTAHVFFPSLEAEPGRPATLSRSVLTGLLREEMAFSGVICTDCLEMKAVSDAFSPDQIALMAVEAGADALLISHTWDVQVAIFEALLRGTKSGRVSAERVAQSAERIVRMKLRREMGNSPGPMTGAEVAEHRAVAAEAARRAVTVAWGAEALPLPPRITLVMPRISWLARVEDSRAVLSDLVGSLQASGIELQAVDCSQSMAEVDEADLARQAGPGGTVVICCAAADRHPRQAAVAAHLSRMGCRVVALARRMPYDLAHLPFAVAGIAMFDESPPMQRAAADVLTGRLAATGRLPVPLASG